MIAKANKAKAHIRLLIIQVPHSCCCAFAPQCAVLRGLGLGRDALGLSARRRRRGVRIQRKAIGVANRTPVFGKYRLCSEG
jgi:hypothetical protein